MNEKLSFWKELQTLFKKGDCDGVYLIYNSSQLVGCNTPVGGYLLWLGLALEILKK